MRNIIPLNFDWKYKPDFRDEYTAPDFDDDDFACVTLPHTNIELPYNNFDERLYQFESCYRKLFIPPDQEEGKRLILCFEGVMTYAVVFINGRRVSEHKGGYTPFKADITDAVLFGAENLIVVQVDSREREEIPPFGYVIDYLTYGGIYREVHLEYVPETRIENCRIITTRIDREMKHADLTLFLKNDSGSTGAVPVECRLLKEGKEIYKHDFRIKLAEKPDEEFESGFDIEGVSVWDLDNPELYELRIELVYFSGTGEKDAGREVFDQKTFRFGFREVEFRLDGFFLNGKQVKIRGLNRHQSFPYVGYAMPKSAQYRDAEILKNELGVNTVRLSHYPQSRHFLDRCDEIGLLVFDEIPGWQHIGESDEWHEIVKQHVKEMITTDWNHPSIFIWGVRINESQDNDELYAETNRIAKELDPVRPTGGVRCIAHSSLLEDVYTYNDFNHNGKRAPLLNRNRVTKKRVPYMVTEHNGHMFPTKKFDHVNHRLEHALRHARVLNAAYGDPEIAGAIGWCMFDYNTHKDFGSGDRICYHGVQDMFRIPKYAAAVYSSQADGNPVMEIGHSMASGDVAGYVRGDVWVFTNCDCVKLYINDEFIKTFYPAVESFPYLSHPPVLIDDFAGDKVRNNESFSPGDADRVKGFLKKIDHHGEALPLADKISLGLLLFKYRMNRKDISDLYNRYFGGWGSASISYRFEGFLDGECVQTRIKSQVFEPRLELKADAVSLTEDETYDVTRLIVRMVDENGEDITYADEPLILSVQGPLEIIGPKQISLIGGSVGFWVKSAGVSGEGRVIVSSERFGILEQKIIVVKR